MLKKLALLAAFAGAVTQTVRYWNQAGAQTAARRKRETKHDVQRWEDEGGNLPEAAGTNKPLATEAASSRARSAPAPVSS